MYPVVVGQTGTAPRSGRSHYAHCLSWHNLCCRLCREEAPTVLVSTLLVCRKISITVSLPCHFNSVIPSCRTEHLRSKAQTALSPSPPGFWHMFSMSDRHDQPKRLTSDTQSTLSCYKEIVCFVYLLKFMYTPALANSHSLKKMNMQEYQYHCIPSTLST